MQRPLKEVLALPGARWGICAWRVIGVVRPAAGAGREGGRGEQA